MCLECSFLFLSSETSHNEVKQPAQPSAQDKKKDEKGKQEKGKVQPKVDLADLDPGVRLLLQEKEQDVMALQESVEILQMKVSKLERLVHLKDMRIENLTRHLETYKAKGNNHK